MCRLFLGGCMPSACGFTALSSFAHVQCKRACAGVKRVRRKCATLAAASFPLEVLAHRGSAATRCVRPPAGVDHATEAAVHVRQRRRRLDAGRNLPRAARRHPAHHRSAVAHRGAPDHRGARRGAEPRLAHGAGADQPEAVRPRPPRVRLLRPPFRVRPADARAHRAGVARRARHLDELHHRLPRLQRPQGQPPARGSAHDACCTCPTCPACTRT